MESKKPQNLGLKFVAGILRAISVLFIFFIIGSGLGPAVDSQASAPKRMENSIFAILAIVFFLTANRIKSANLTAFWVAGIGCLGLAIWIMSNVLAGRGVAIVQIIISFILLAVPVILFRNRHLATRSPFGP